MEGWLKKRLAPPKINEPRWAALADALERAWEEFFDPRLSSLERLRSPYLADDADLSRKIKELGDYFAVDWPKKEGRPIALAWRRLELEYKDLELILASVFRRHYSNLPVAWIPIFAAKGAPYGSAFMAADGPIPETVKIPPEGMFLTSRGRLGVDYGYLLSMGLFKGVFLGEALPLLMRTKPLHIVYDGPLWHIRFDNFFDVRADEAALFWERESGLYELPFAVEGARFDFTPADAANLDIGSLACEWAREWRQSLPFIPESAPLWHLDFHIPPLPEDGWPPLDALIPGVECSKNPASQAGPISILDFAIPCAPMAAGAEAAREKPISIYPGPIKAADSFMSEAISAFEAEAGFAAPGRLDYFPRFDDFPADGFPLDMPIGGAYA